MELPSGATPAVVATAFVAHGVVTGARNFLGRVFNPAADEFGGLLRDAVKSWRDRNAVRMLAAAETITSAQPNGADLKANPRIVHEVYEHGSWTDDEHLQAMWAGLLATSCTESGKEDDQLPFIHTLSQLTRLETKLLEYSCTRARIGIGPWNLIHQYEWQAKVEDLKLAVGVQDNPTLDIACDHLRHLGVFDKHSGFSAHPVNILVLPSAFSACTLAARGILVTR